MVSPCGTHSYDNMCHPSRVLQIFHTMVGKGLILSEVDIGAFDLTMFNTAKETIK